MPLILAIEPDARQAAQLATIVHQRLGAELIVAETTERALGAIGNRVPDLVLVPALLSPQDDAALAAALRVIATAAHVQMLTIPVLGSERPKRIKARGMFSALRGERRSTTSPDGCDPGVFAEQIASYLERAAEERATARATVQKHADEPAIEAAHSAPEPDITLEFLAAEPAIGERPLSVHDEQQPPIVEEQPQPAIFDSQGTRGTQIERPPAGLEDTPAEDVEKPLATVVHESPVAGVDATPAIEAGEAPEAIVEDARIASVDEPHTVCIEQSPDVVADASPAIAAGQTPDGPPVVFEEAHERAVDEPAAAGQSFAAVDDGPPAIVIGETPTVVDETPEAVVEDARMTAIDETHTVLVEQPPDVVVDASPAIAAGQTPAEPPVVFEEPRALAGDESAAAEEPSLAAVAERPAAAVGESPLVLAVVVDEQGPAVVEEQLPVVLEEQRPIVLEKHPLAVVDEELPLGVDQRPPAIPDEQPCAVVLEQLLTASAEYSPAPDEEHAAVLEEHPPVLGGEQPPIVLQEETPAVSDRVEIEAPALEYDGAPVELEAQLAALVEAPARTCEPPAVDPEEPPVEEKPYRRVFDTRRLPILDELLAELEKGSVPVIEEVQTDEWMDVHEIPAETAAGVDLAAELERAILQLRPFHIVKPAKRPEREEPAPNEVPSETVDPSGGVDMLEEFKAFLELPSEEPLALASELWMPLSFGPAPMWPPLECRAAEPPPESFDAPADFIDEVLALPDVPSPANWLAGAPDLFDVAKDAFEPVSIVAQPPPSEWAHEAEATSEFERVPPAAVPEPRQEPELPVEDSAITPAAAREQTEWVELIESLRSDIERLRTERTVAAAPPPRAPEAVERKPKGRTKKAQPIQDEWGFFDPEQCGFAALLAKLEEITETTDDTKAQPPAR